MQAVTTAPADSLQVRRALSPFRGLDIDNLLETVHSSSERVRICAESVQDDILVDTHKTVADSHEIARVIRKTTGDTGREVEEIREQVAEILRRQRSLKTTLDAISGKNGLFQFLLEHLSKSFGSSGSLGTFAHLSLEVQKSAPEPREQEGERKSQEEATPTITPSRLLALLNVNHLAAINDETHVMRRGKSLDSGAIGQAAVMIKTPQVEQLLHAPQSGIVLVEGCGDRSQATTRISPISYVCATLAQALRASDTTGPNAGSTNVVLVFFCGQHVVNNDDLQGPQGLIRSLLAQLILILVQNEWMSETAPIKIPQEVTGSLSLEDDCWLFYQLLGLIPRQTSVFCLVDGISYYERECWRRDYDLAIDVFAKIISDEKLGICVKLLMTSPTTSNWLSNLAPHQRVTLRSVRVGAGALTDRALWGISRGTYPPM